MTITAGQNTARVSYAVAQGVTQTSFSVPFEFFNDGDLKVYVDGTLKTITTDYTVSGGDGSTGTVTMSVTGASGGSTVIIVRDIPLERTTDFPSSGAFDIAALNTELDTIIAIASDIDTAATRSLRLSDTDTTTTLTIPDTDTRKGTVLGFNATTGAVEAGPTIADVSTLSAITADISTLADIEDGTDATDAIQSVAGVASNVTTVAGISGNVTTVAGISSDVTSVAGNVTNINTVAGNDSNITTVAGISGDVTSVAGITSNIATVVANIADIQDADNQATAAAASASAAATSESNAATSESNASTSASTASTQAGISTTKAAEAASSATSAASAQTASEAARDLALSYRNTAETHKDNAATSATNAATSATASSNSATSSSASATSAASAQTAAEAARDSALAAFDSFDDRYLGVKASNPTTDNDGDALAAGMLYFNSTSNAMQVYTGTGWTAAYVSGTGFAALTGATFTGDVTIPNVVVSGTVDGRDVSADGTKLDGIEANATADQTASEIRTLVENATDSNVFTDADHTKLDGIEASATADQTGAEIKTAYEAEADTNAFTDALLTKLNGIETSATGDQTASEILTSIKTVDGSGSGLDADLLDGLEVHTGRNNEANKVVRTDGNGYAQMGWINTTSGSTTNTINKIYASNDDYVRYITPATFRSQVINGQTINEIYNNGWYRTYGAKGWYNQTYGGGIYMEDSTYVRTYGSKQLYVNTHIKAASNVYAYWSDDRLKTKIGNIDNALHKVQSLSGFTYVRNDVAKSHGFEGDEEEVGVSAQQVKAVLPQAIHLAPFDEKVEDDGTIVSKSGEDYMTVDYPRLVPLLIEAIKELKAEVDELKAGCCHGSTD